MKTTDLYIRVSTEEQTSGYSPRYQEEMLRRYCDLHSIHIRHVYFEDHSAKNFDRPEFKKLLINIRKQKGITDLVLFTKWDRFSRNAGDAYAMISTLNKLGVDPQAIEQPLDLSVPENKMMLAFYLAAPEVENHRRALNVSGGMRRAKKEGRYMGKAPFGYINKSQDRNKWIEPHPTQAVEVVAIFETIALGKFSIESILKFTRSKGYKMSKNNFWNIIRNPVYAGKIVLPAFKNEEAQLVTAQHQPLISEHLFNQVQDVLNAKKKTQRTKKAVDDKFPLRGYVQCHADGKLLTASSSKGRKQYYHYYHCTSQCGTRFPATALHSAITQELARWVPHPAVKALYKIILDDVISQNDQHRKQELKNTQQQLKYHSDRLIKARELVLIAAIEPDDFKIIKRECEAATSQLEAKLITLMEQEQHIGPLIEAGLSSLENIVEHYETKDSYIKRQIIDSIFPEKLVFDGVGFRTTKVNEAVQVIFNLGAAFSQIKMGQVESISDLSHEVNPLVHFSNHFLFDLKKLAALHSLLKAS